MQLDDALRRAEAYAVAFEFSPVKPLEGLEKIVLIGHVEAGAVVLDEECRLLPGEAELDKRHRFEGAIFPGVAEEILQQLLEQGVIAHDYQFSLDAAFDLPTRIELLQHAEHRLRQFAQVHPLLPDLRPPDPGRLQQVIDESPHPFRGVDDPAQVILGITGKVPGILLKQNRAETVDVAQRGAQVVRDRVAESLLVFDRCLQGRSPFTDALFE